MDDQIFQRPRRALPPILRMKERVRAYTDSPHAIVNNHFVVIMMDCAPSMAVLLGKVLKGLYPHKCDKPSQAKPNHGITSGGAVFLRYAIHWQCSIRHQDKSPQNVLNSQHFLDTKMRRRLQALSFHWCNICCFFGQTFLRHQINHTIRDTVSEGHPRLGQLGPRFAWLAPTS